MEDVYEVDLEDVYHYRLSYGGQSPFFAGLQQGKLVGSRCTGCGHVWVPCRPICSKCYADSQALELSGEAEILTVITLPVVPEHLRHLGKHVASALVLPDGSDCCLKAFFAGDEEQLRKGARVRAKFLPAITTIADFYFACDDIGSGKDEQCAG